MQNYIDCVIYASPAKSLSVIDGMSSCTAVQLHAEMEFGVEMQVSRCYRLSYSAGRPLEQPSSRMGTAPGPCCPTAFAQSSRNFGSGPFLYKLFGYTLVELVLTRLYLSEYFCVQYSVLIGWTL